jgi:replication-associated recombination protein RarA
MDIIQTRLPIHTEIYEKLDYFYRNNKIPHIIFHGSSGCGKKTLVYDFIYKIYNNDKQKIKNNVIFVNCSHGKGIKFIREELKFFAKTNLQSNTGVKFKSIVLFNADSLTNDAQSALRRCIELFSNNTRFFIVVENKHKLLNPILSRFCEIFVPEYMVNNEIVNLHKYNLNKKFNFEELDKKKKEWLEATFERLISKSKTPEKLTHEILSSASCCIYETGYSCLDIIEYISKSGYWTDLEISNIEICFHKIKSEFRSEKLLMLYMLDFIFADSIHIVSRI